MKQKTKLSPIQRILQKAGGSTTEVARRLTQGSTLYYTINQVAHWVRSDQIPPQHMSVVSRVFAMPVEEVCPELFQQHHQATEGAQDADKQ